MSRDQPWPGLGVGPGSALTFPVTSHKPVGLSLSSCMWGPTARGLLVLAGRSQEGCLWTVGAGGAVQCPGVPEALFCVRVLQTCGVSEPAPFS